MESQECKPGVVTTLVAEVEYRGRCCWNLVRDYTEVQAVWLCMLSSYLSLLTWSAVEGTEPVFLNIWNLEFTHKPQKFLTKLCIIMYSIDRKVSSQNWFNTLMVHGLYS